jgi:hypothetical protein
VKRVVISAGSGSKDSKGPTTYGTACSLATRGSNGLIASSIVEPLVGDPTVRLCRANVREAAQHTCFTSARLNGAVAVKFESVIVSLRCAVIFAKKNYHFRSSRLCTDVDACAVLYSWTAPQRNKYTLLFS